MAWTNLSFPYGSVLTSAKLTQLYDNFGYGAGAPSLQSPTLVTPALGTPASGTLDACTTNTEAVGTNSTQLANTAYCMAGFVDNDVGTGGVGAFLMAYSTNTVLAGATTSGSSLNPAGYASGVWGGGGSGLSGTWRSHSAITINNGDIGPFQRIS